MSDSESESLIKLAMKEKPLSPSQPFFQFQRNNWLKFKKEFPGEPLSGLTRKILQAFEQLPNEEKDAMQALYNEKYEKYQQDIKEWTRKNPDIIKKQDMLRLARKNKSIKERKTKHIISSEDESDDGRENKTKKKGKNQVKKNKKKDDKKANKSESEEEEEEEDEIQEADTDEEEEEEKQDEKNTKKQPKRVTRSQSKKPGTKKKNLKEYDTDEEDDGDEDDHDDDEDETADTKKKQNNKNANKKTKTKTNKKLKTIIVRYSQATMYQNSYKVCKNLIEDTYPDQFSVEGVQLPQRQKNVFEITFKKNAKTSHKLEVDRPTQSQAKKFKQQFEAGIKKYK